MKKSLISLAIGLLMAACGPGPSTVTTDAGPTVDAGPSCVNRCPDATSVRCVANSVETCDLQADGCLDWSTAIACPSNQTCSNGRCESASCHDACSAGAVQCTGNSVEQCQSDSNGCLVWSEPVACGSNQTCSNGRCESPTCHDQCSMGAFQCAGNAVEQCVAGADGCLQWSAPVACGDNQTCSNGQCKGQGCTNDCNMVGALMCAGNAVEQCITGSNGCLVWNPVSMCAADQTCKNGQCMSSCVDACPSEGQGQCVGSSIQVCERGTNGCLAWSMPAQCGPGLSCQSGQCQSNCQDPCPSAGATECSGNGVQTCQLQPNGCLQWNAVQACSANQTCDASSGQCITTMMMQQSTVGAACTQNTDCTAGPGPQCLPDSSGFPGGYCTSSCAQTSDCGASGTCVSGFQDANGNPLSACLGVCSSNTDCRPGYFCATNGQQDFCYPKCTSNADCGSGNVCDTTTGACSVANTTGYPAAFPMPPQVITNGGPVLSAPKIVPIFFSNDDMTIVSDLSQFYSQIGGTSYWKAVSEYGVGTATATTPVIISDVMAPPTVNDTLSSGSDVWTFLQNEINAGHLPAPDANTLYVINYPAGTTITAGSEQSCTYFGGYHAEMDGNTNVAYAVLPRCQPLPGYTLEQMVTVSASHELVEASTDPFPFSNPGWYSVDVNHYFWNTAMSGSEIGDMCAQDPEANYIPADLNFAVQRFWSNSTVPTGHDPCVPGLPSEVFFNTVPELNDTINYPVYNGQTLPVVGVKVQVGQSKTIPLDLYSDAATSGPWNVQVMDLNQAMGQSPDLALSLDKSSGQNGDKINLTIKPTAAGPGNTDVFYVISSMGTGSTTTYHIWVGVVGEQP